MTIIYRDNDPVSGRWSGIGTDLSAFQIDGNFYECVSRIATLESSSHTTVSIGFITITGSELTFHMTDHSLQGPFAIPSQTFTDRGAWTPLTSYLVNDTLNENGTLYLVIFPHTSASSFDAGANDGAGHNYYSPMLSLPGAALPTGGATGQVLTKSSGTDFATTWSYKLPTGGNTGQVLTKASNTNQDADWETPSTVSAPPPSPAGTPGQTLATVDGTASAMEWVTRIAAPPPSPAGTPGQVLATVDGTTDNMEWIDPGGGGGGTLESLTDVTVSGASVGDAPVWNGTSWDNTPVQPFDAQLFSNIPQNSRSANYTTVNSDAQKHVFHPSADTSARTYTIDSNVNSAQPIGATIMFVNQHGAGTVTIAINSDTMRLAGSGATGNRTLAPDGWATALKIDTTEWIISGPGLT